MPRGGARSGAGRKPKPLHEKLAAGNPGHRPLKKVDFDQESDVKITPPEYLALLDKEVAGIPSPVELFNGTVEHLRPSGCLPLIPPDLLAEHAVAKHYLLAAQYELSNTALVALNEKEELVITSFAEAMLKMQKNCAATWLPIWSIVQRNAERMIVNPEEDMMLQIVAARQRSKKSEGVGK